jgi:poly(3-hydroxybutyrate) depolymerase
MTAARAKPQVSDPDEFSAPTGCPIGPRIQRTGPVTHSVWAPCAAGTAVELYGVAGSGHEWPGSSPPLAGHDPPSPALDATQVIWHFFQQHQRSTVALDGNGPRRRLPVRLSG